MIATATAIKIELHIYYYSFSKRMTASQALEHRFLELAFQRGLGDRIPIDKLKAYHFRRKCEVSRKHSNPINK